jgi:hypothetical protein
MSKTLHSPAQATLQRRDFLKAGAAALVVGFSADATLAQTVGAPAALRNPKSVA